MAPLPTRQPQGAADEDPRAGVHHIWLDFQQMELFEQDPLIIVAASGLRVRTDDGREFIDAIGGAMVSTLGYGDGAIRQAMPARGRIWRSAASSSEACSTAAPNRP